MPKTLKELEKEHILAVVEENNWNITLSARLLGSSRATVYRKLKEYGIQLKAGA